MGEIICRTYLDKSPNGLVPVLFCSAEEDRDRFFEQLTAKILKLRTNVAVYAFKDVNDISLEQIYSMKLIVVPVTMAFLHRNCVARESILKPAMEKNIPILPILEEKGIEVFFNRIVGNLQCLNAVQSDDTEIPFDRKFEDFLERVIVNDAEIKNIRDAFDTYIFLSYRKKDRAHANEVMRLIHENDFMRDVAIWYDEYLVPGENFDDSIRDALLKSKLMALVVTPNLTNEDNYVKNIEYPMAVENGKAVIPIEAVPTDEGLFKEYYKGIREKIPTLDKNRIGNMFRECIFEPGMAQNNDPDHLYYIALAYLLGIDVETNADRALELLFKAKDAGSLEAADKLVEIYMSGLYVPADYKKAAVVRAESIAEYEASIEDTAPAYLRLIGMMKEMTEILKAVGQLEAAASNAKKVADYYNGLKKYFPEEADDSVIAGALKDYADILAEIPGQEEEAFDWYQEVIGLYMELYEENGYDRRWDVLPLMSRLTKVTGEDWFSRSWKISYDYAKSASQKGREAMCDYSTSHAMLLLQFCEYNVEILKETDGIIKRSRMELLNNQEQEIKGYIRVLCQNGRDEIGYTLLEKYMSAFGDLKYELGEKKEAMEMYENAFRLLFEKFDTPDKMLTQIDNAYRLIKIGEELNDSETEKYARYTLTDIPDKLIAATGMDKYQAMLDENESVIESKGW